MKCYVITVTGHVQGVFFRDSARETALRLGLAGFARNEADGSVHIEVEGDKAQLDEFLEWCKQGPPQALVTTVGFRDEKPKGYKGFEIH